MFLEKLAFIEQIETKVHDAGTALSVERIFGLKSREFQNFRPDILSKQIIQGE